MSYARFLEGKALVDPATGLADVPVLNPMLFEFQRDIVRSVPAADDRDQSLRPRREGQAMKRKYGYGIIDRHGKPWWDESCVCEDRGPLLETLAVLNDRLDMGYEDKRAPYRVVRLFWTSTRGKRRG